MDTNKSFGPLLLGGIALVSVVAYVMNLGGETLAANFTEDLRSTEIFAQQGVERVWQSEEWVKTLTLESTAKVDLFGPLHVRETNEGDILVRDSGDLTVKRFSAEGIFQQAYGQGRGQGPGEFSRLSDHGAGPDGQVWTADPSNGRITIFEEGGDVAETLRLPRPPYRLSLQANGEGFFVMVPPSSELFARFGMDGEELSSFGVLLEDQGANALALDGWIRPMPDGGFVFGARFVGLLVVYDAQGELRYLAQTVDYLDLPKLIRNGKQTWVDRKAAVAMYSLSVTDEGIHVLATEKEGSRLRGAIDTYSLEDGRYLYSKRLPERCHSIHVTPDHLYTTTGSAINRWAAAPAG